MAEEPSLDGRLLLETVVDAVVDLVKEAGDGDEGGRAEQLEVVHEAVHGSLQIDGGSDDVPDSSRCRRRSRGHSPPRIARRRGRGGGSR